MNLENVFYESPLNYYVKNSGKHPISLQGHYDHWLKYNGKRMSSVNVEHGIKIHLQNLRMDRHVTQLQLKKLKEKSLKNRKTGIRSRKSTLKNRKESSKILSYDNDTIESGSTWWHNSPLPAISTEREQNNENQEEKDIPFTTLTTIEKRFECLKYFSSKLSPDIMTEYYNSKIIHIYVASSNYDMKNEISKLEISIWPYLRELCLQYNKTLLIHNLHIYSEELLALGMDQYKKEIMRSIKICTNQNSQHMKALILFGDEIDKKDPPTYLTKRELSLIKLQMKPDIEKLTSLQADIQILKQKKLQAKQILKKIEASLEKVDEFRESNKNIRNQKKSELEKINHETNNLKKEIEKLSYQANIDLLDQWYRKDPSMENMFKVVPESEIIKDLKNADYSKRKLARVTLENIKNQLCFIINTYSPNIMEQKKTFFEQEIESLEALILEGKCLLVSRTFSNKEMNENVTNLRKILLQKINKENQVRYELELHETGKLSLNELRNHASYLEQVSFNIQEVLKESIIESIKKEDMELLKLKNLLLIDTMEEKDQLLLFSELSLQHKILKDRMCSTEELFTEMKEFLEEVKQSVFSENIISLISGTPISGKTNVMCNLITKLLNRQPKIGRSGYMVIYRILGTSFQNNDVTKLLRSICLQLIYETGLELNIPYDFSGLKTLLHQILMSIEFPIFFLIDGIDHLKELKVDSVFLLSWLPIGNKNVSIVLSGDKDSPASQCLINYVKNNEIQLSNFHVPNLSIQTISYLMNNFVSVKNLNWTDEQKESLISNIESCRSIGFVLSNCRVAQIWTPNSSIPKLGLKLDQNILYYFARLEEQIGEPIIRRLLGYITSFKNGVTFTELIDIMVFDETVRKFVRGSMLLTDSTEYTYSLLRCIFNELDDYLGIFVDETGLQMIKWMHISFEKAATNRYLLQKDKAPSYHQAISYYFMNNVTDLEIFSQIKENESDLPSYPAYLVKQNIIFDPNFKKEKTHFNHRKISLLPYHLMQLQNQKLLKHICLFNFYWLQSAIIDYGINYVIDTLKSAYEMEPEDLEYPLFIDLLQLSLVNITDDPLQLGSQILGRITDIIRSDRQTKEVRKYTNLDVLYKSIPKNCFQYVFVPSKSCMKPPGSLTRSLVGLCFGNVTCMIINESCTRLFVSTDNGVLYIWDTTKNAISSIIMGIGKNIFQMILNQTDVKLITALPDIIEIWDVVQKVVLVQLYILYDPYYLTISADKSLFSAIFYGTSWIITWNFESFNLLFTKKLSLDTTVNNKGEIICSNICNKFFVVTAVKCDNKAALVDIRNGEINSKPLLCKEKGSAITKVAISINYYVLCSKGVSSMDSSTLIYFIDLIDIESLQNIRRITGCVLDSVSNLVINSVGSHAITLNNNTNLNITDFSIWNLETEEHKHCCEIENVMDICDTKDFARIFLSSKKSKQVFKYNIQTALQTVKSKTVNKRDNYVVKRYEINDRYVFLMNQNNSIIEVYNMMKNKKGGKKSWSILSIVGNDDMLLPFKDKFIILSNKCYSSVVPDCKNVFQMIKIFDLVEGRIISQTKEVFIYPCRRKEFIVLNEDLLIGLADNRSHIVSWNLSAGQIQWRIRPNNSVLSLNKSQNNNDEDNSSIHTNRNSVRSTIHDLVIDSVLPSGDLSTLIVSYFSPFLCVFSLTDKCHNGTLSGDFSLLNLHVASVTFDGSYLIQYNFNDKSSSKCLSLWNTKTEAQVDCIKVKNNILTVAINKTASMASYLEINSGIFVWRIDLKCHNILPRSQMMSFRIEEQNCQLEFLQNDSVLLSFNGLCFQMWDIKNNKNEFISIFHPDQHIQSYTTCFNDQLLVFTLKGSNELFSLKVLGENQIGYKYSKSVEKYLEKNEMDSKSSSEEED